MDYFMQGFGVFLGVIAGTTVTLLAAIFFQLRNQKQQVKNLRFELELNIRKIDGWLDDLQSFRNAINGDTLHNYFGYFDLSRAVSGTANAMFLSGMLYKKLTHDQIGALQEIFNHFSLFGEQYMNNQIAQAKQAFEQCRSENNMEFWTTQQKPEAVGIVDFWEGKFQDHRKALDQIVKSLK